jgi:hypothetical protein
LCAENALIAKTTFGRASKVSGIRGPRPERRDAEWMFGIEVGQLIFCGAEMFHAQHESGQHPGI